MNPELKTLELEARVANLEAYVDDLQGWLQKTFNEVAQTIEDVRELTCVNGLVLGDEDATG